MGCGNPCLKSAIFYNVELKCWPRSSERYSTPDDKFRSAALIRVHCANVHKVPLSSAVFSNESSGPLLAKPAIVVRP